MINMKGYICSALLYLVPALSFSGGVSAEGVADRDFLKGVVRQVLVSMAEHDPSTLPLAQMYRLTVDNKPSGPEMATPWRTITGFKELERGQYVIDTPRQEIFFVTTVMEGNMPSMLYGRLKVNNLKLTEVELFLDRSKADTGMQFEPEGLTDLPDEWVEPVPEAKRPGREELTRAARAIFNPEVYPIVIDPGCELTENGRKVTALVDVETFKKVMMPDAPQEVLDRVAKDYKEGKETSLICDRVEPPVDKNSRILVDEVQSAVVNLAIIPAKVFANFRPGPEPHPVYPTIAAPDAMIVDQKERVVDMEALAKKSKTPVFETMSIVLAVAEMTKFYDDKVQGTHRIMQVQPVGSGSPWVDNNWVDNKLGDK